MALVNAFGALGLEATLQLILTELQQKLETGAPISLDAPTLAALENIVVSGSVGLDAPTLAVIDPTGDVATLTSVAVGVVSVTLKAAEATRKNLVLYNAGPNAVLVALGASSSLSAYTVALPALASREVAFYTGAVSAICAATESAAVKVTSIV